jgi:hypothetical protein
VVKKFSHIHKYRALRLPPHGDGGAGGYDVKKYIKCQLALSSTDATTGAPLDASGVQLPGVLDALFAYNGPLGAHVSDDAVTLTLWAPTAQVISFKLATLGNLLLLICQLFQTLHYQTFPVFLQRK